MKHFADQLKFAYPAMPNCFEEAVHETLSSLSNDVPEKKRCPTARILSRVAAAACLLIVVSACVFAVKPALATHIPVVNYIVYELSPTVEATEEQKLRMLDALKNHIKFKGESFSCSSIEATQRGFRFEAIITYDLLAGEDVYATQTASVQFEEDAYGFTLIHHEVLITTKQGEPDAAPSFQTTMEDLATELFYRYWNGCKELEFPDLTDIVEYNEDTELFLYKLKLHIEDIRLRTRSPVVVAERGFVESLERLDETDTTYTGHFSVRTFIDGGLIEQWVLTISKGKHPKIVKIDQMVGDGVFRNRLKPLVRQFRDEGMSKTEANKAAYETLLEESQRVVEEHPEWLIKNTP